MGLKQHLISFSLVTISHHPVNGDSGVDLARHFIDPIHPTNGGIFTGNNGCRCAFIGRYKPGGNIAISHIF